MRTATFPHRRCAVSGAAALMLALAALFGTAGPAPAAIEDFETWDLGAQEGDDDQDPGTQNSNQHGLLYDLGGLGGSNFF